MKAASILVSTLTTIEQCDNAIASIESDVKNIQGGLKAWNSGYETHLTKSASNKIAAIQRKSDKLYSKLYDEDGNLK